MYRKIVWCYLIVLTLLDISLNTKLSAQGKSHGNGASVHESLMEGISLQQEWSSSEGGAGAGVGAGAGGAVLTLQPAMLAFGQRALAAAHALRVTITNTANETVHLASVAGTTPDFHASFFESKTLAPQANTSFSVVFLGRREGPVASHLYIHTSKGVHKFPVSAVGVASDWRVWPLVGLRVPHNATLEPLLTLYNPTETTIQVQEVYSSGAWLGLSLPEGGEAAPRAAWTLPPHCARPLVRLAVRLPPASALEPRAAYIRIKGNMTGGGLVVGVEASPAPAGEFLSPVQLRLRTRGSMDAPDSVWIEAGSSSPAGAEVAAGATGACRASALAAPHPAPPPPPQIQDKHTHNGAKADATGIHISLVRDEMEPMQELKPTAQITLDYAKMWAGYVSSLENGSAANGAGGGVSGAQGGAFCTGWVTLGRAALPYSVRLLPGSMELEPTELHFITCNKEEALRARTVQARNHFPEPLLVSHVHFPPEVLHLFHVESMAPMELAAGARGVVARLRLKEARAGPAHASLALHTNLSDYTLPLLLYEGVPAIEWEWPESADGVLRLGALGAGEAGERRVGLRLRNRGAAPLCLTRLHARLPPPASAALQLLDAHRQASCIPAGGSTRAVLTVRVSGGGGGGGGGELAGAALAHTRHGAAAAAVRLSAHAGALLAAPVHLPPAAPYMPGVGALEVDNSMPLRMRVVSVAPPPSPPGEPAPATRALTYIPGESAEIGPGRSVVGHVRYEPAELCRPRCYTGLQLDTPEGAAWASRAAEGAGVAGVAGGEGSAGGEGGAGLALDATLQRARHALYQHARHNFTLQLHTTEVLGVAVQGSGSLVWPRVRGEAGEAGEAGGGRAGLAGVGAAVPLRMRAHNPAAHPLLLQARLAAHAHALGGLREEEEEACVGCVWSEDSFQLGEWRITRGAAAPHRPPGAPEPGPHEPPYLLLQPGAELELTVTFTPSEPADLAAYLYLRNNLTIVERVLVRGRGALPAFELGGRRPNSTSAIVLEVAECGAAGGAGGATRALALRNTGRVPLRLRSWRVGGQACGGRAFRVTPCGPLRLAPGDAHTLHVQYAADWTRARAHATLSVRAGASLARFPLAGLAPARLLAACAPAAQRAPFEDQLRALGLTLATLALLGALGLGAADAERALRRHRGAREAAPAGPPLDLRAIGRAAPAPPLPAPPAPPRPAPPPPPPRRRRAARGRAGAAGGADAAAERLAFSRWRAGAGAAPRDDSRSSEEGEGAPPPPAPPPRGDAESSSPDSSPPPRDSYSSLSRRAEEGASSGEDSSSASPSASPSPAPAPHAPPQGPVSQAAHAPNRGSRQRRSSAEARRSERKSAERGADTSSNGAGPPRPPAPRPHARGGRAARRRGERAASPAPRAASPEPRAPPAQAPHPAVRWGASWSDVVSRGNAAGADDGGAGMAPAPLAPIGSDVRRRLGSHSLFYYGSAPAWPPAAPGAPPPPPAPLAPEDNGGYRSLESLWGSSVEPLAPGAAWLWGGGGGAQAAPPAPCPPVRPPPGFSAPRPVRPYDPFQSLASIWTPAALDWRLDSSSPPPPPGPGPPPPGTPPLADDKPEPPGPAV